MTVVLVERLRRNEIMDRFHAVIEAEGGDALSIPELCAALSVSQRALHGYCRESFGTSPKRYLHQRRLHLARGMLTNLSTLAVTVTEAAAQFGFWNFGRFSADYRQLFGETPSQTLKNVKVGRSSVVAVGNT